MTQSKLSPEMYSQYESTWAYVVLDGVRYDRYKINQLGEVYDFKNNRLLSTYANDQGYMYVRIVINTDTGEFRLVRVHRLVAETFIPNPYGYPEVDHIDCDKTHNWVSNLEWVTSRENKLRAIRNGLYVNSVFMKAGEDKPTATHTDDQIHAICRMLEQKYSPKEIAETLNVDVAIIRNILHNDKWRHISSQYKIPRNGERATSVRRYTTDIVKQLCEMLEKGVPDKEIAETLNVSIDLVYDVRMGKRFTGIASDYTFARESRRVIFDEWEIRAVCKMLEEGKNAAEIVAKYPQFSAGTVNSIKAKRSYTDISSQYKIPELQEHSRSYRAEALELILQGLRYDEILEKLGLEDTPENRGYLSGLKSAESAKHGKDANPVFKVRTAQIRKAKLVDSLDCIHEICKLLEQKVHPSEIATKMNVPTNMVNEIRLGKRFKTISEQYNIERTHMIRNYTDDDIRTVCDLIQKGYSTPTISSMITVIPKSTISAIRSGRMFTEISKDYGIKQTDHPRTGSRG